METKFYCMRWDSNSEKPVAINILKFIDGNKIKNMVKYKGSKPDRFNSIKTYRDLREYLKAQFMYYFWSRCENEMLVGNISSGIDEARKIDVYAQIVPNLDLITKLVIDELKLKIKDTKEYSSDDFGLEVY